MKSDKKRVAEKIINIILNIAIFVFGIILLISIYTGVQTKILGNKYTNFFGYSLFEVQTGSMEEAISPGDWIIVKLTSKVKLDDIITYELEGEFITHRIIEVYQGTFITKGDANPAKDKPVDQRQVVGKVINILPNFGILRKTLFNPSVLITLIITLGLFNLAFKDNKKRKSEDKMKNSLIKLLQKLKETLIKENKKIEEKLSSQNNFKELLYKVDSEKVVQESVQESVEDASIVKIVSIEEKTKNQPEVAVTKEEFEQMEEVEKTSLFRVISVEPDEISKKYKALAKQETKKNVKEKTKEISKDILPIEKDFNTINLESAKKTKTIIDRVIYIESEKINELIDILIDENKNQTIKKQFLNSYIDFRYYGDFNKGNKLKQVMDNLAEELIKEYKGKNKNYNDIVNNYSKMFVFLSTLERACETLSDIKIRTEFFTKEFIKQFKEIDIKQIDKKIREVKKIQSKYNKALDYFLKSLKINSYNLDINQFSTNKNICGLNLNYKNSDKKENINSEEEVPVLFTLLSSQLVLDILSYNYNKNYVFKLPLTLFEKEKKMDKLLKMFDEKYAKNKIIILVDYFDYVKNKKSVQRIIKLGYQVALLFNEQIVLKEKDKSNFKLINYVIIDKKNLKSETIIPYIPQSLSNAIIYEDLTNKIGNFGGD